MNLEKIANKIRFDKIKYLIPLVESFEVRDRNDYSSIKEKRQVIWDAYWADMIKGVVWVASGWFVYEVAKRIF